VSLIYLVTSLPILNRNNLQKINKKQFFLRAYQCLDKSEQNDLNLLLLKERVDFFINLHAEAVGRNPFLKTNEIVNIYRRNAKRHFTNIGDVYFPKWVYEPLAPNEMLRLWYSEVFNNSMSSFFINWAKFSLLEEAIVGFIAKESKLDKNAFCDQIKGSSSIISDIMIKNYNNDMHLGLKTRYNWSKNLLDIISISSAELLEKKINDIRIQNIKKMRPMNYFSFDFLVAYYFELSIYVREASFNIDCGRKILDKILTSTTEAA
jgi:hypothetical protein